MKWQHALIIAVILLIVFIIKKAGQISSKDAKEQLSQGAIVIDVRSRGEFASGHLPKAINIPLDEIGATVPKKFQDKNQVLLLHCQSGMRSAVAAKQLKSLGYTHVSNLGSLSRAKSIVAPAD